MGNIKIILKKDVYGLGEEGDVKNVKSGYARNFLFPREFAVDYSLQNRNILERQKALIEKKRLDKKENANELKAKLEGVAVSVSITAGEKGRLYGTVTTALIHEELVKAGFDIDRKKIELKEHIKFAGSYKYTIHLYQDIYATCDVTVIAKEEEKKVDDRNTRRKKRFTKRHDNFDEQNFNEMYKDPQDYTEEHKEESAESTSEEK